MKKIHIIILIASVVVCFGATFAVVFFTQGSKSDLAGTAGAGKELVPTQAISSVDVPTVRFIHGDEEDLVRSMTEKQLQSLIYDVREKMKKYRLKEKELANHEERIRLAHERLEEEIEELNRLHDRLSTTMAELRQQEESLEQTKLEIDEIEKANMRTLAERYDKMDVVHAAKIMVNMVGNGQIDDVAMIIFYMSERQSAKLLGEIGNVEPDIASTLNEKLSRVKEIG